jgi:hypothetical protein
MSSIVETHRDRVLARIDRLSDSWWLFSTFTGAVIGGWLIVAALMIAVVLDILLQFDSTARPIVIGAWAAVAIGTLVITLVRPLWRSRRSSEGTARKLEDIFDELGSDLINVVQLSRGNDCPSKMLQQAAVVQSSRHAENVPLESAARQLTLRQRLRDCMNTPRDLALAGAVWVLILVAGGILHMMFPAWPNSVYRLFHPTRFVPAVGAVRIVEVTPGDAELLIGESLTVAARVENSKGKAHDGVLVAIAQDGSEQRYALVPSENYDRYRFTFPKVTDSFRYRLEVGGTQTQHYAVSVFDRPAVRSLSAGYRYPAYTGLAEATVKLKGGQIEAPQFTHVSLTINTNTPVKTAVVKLGKREVPGTTSPTRPVAEASFQIAESGTYSVQLTDARGNTNSSSTRYPIRVVVDQPPKIDLRNPPSEIAAAAGETVALDIDAQDDYGLSKVELLSRRETDENTAEKPVRSWTKFNNSRMARLHFTWKLPEDLKDGTVVLYRLSARDNRQASYDDHRYGPQVTYTAARRIRIFDRGAYLTNKLNSLEDFRRKLLRIYKRQVAARTETTPLTTAKSAGPQQMKAAASVAVQQHEVKDLTANLAGSLSDKQRSLLPFKSTLANLAAGRMTAAADLARKTSTAETAGKLNASAARLVGVQDDILDVLRRLLALARTETSRALAAMKKRPGGDLPDDTVGSLKALRDKLKAFLKEQRKVIEASEDLAKKPVEDFTEKDKQKLKDLAASEDDWSRFMKQLHSDLSRLPEQDFSNPSMLEESIEINTQLKMAADALTKKSVEIAVPLEQLGAEMAEELTANIEKWLPDTPDRERWSQEEPLTDAMREAPMAELPHELEDLVGKLMENEEDLFDEMEDISSSWADSINKGAGWDAADGPISNMSAKGVTGNRLPNTSEIGGRSAEGRQGKSSGEFVGDTAVGKGGRKTPSRLTPDPFEKGQVKDTSKDPVGGATGGGKESGQGGEGLEGPVPPPVKRKLSRLAGRQAALRNRAETIRLQFQIVNYNTADLDTLIKRMKTVEAQLRSGRVRSVLRRRDVMLGSLRDLRGLVTKKAEVKSDVTSSVPQEIRKKILGSMQEASPAGWEKLNRSYFERIANGK